MQKQQLQNEINYTKAFSAVLDKIEKDLIPKMYELAEMYDREKDGELLPFLLTKLESEHILTSNNQQ